MDYYAQIASEKVQHMTAYGYARVSTNGQDLASQEAELSSAGCAKVFKEKVSGAKTDRTEIEHVSKHRGPHGQTFCFDGGAI